jgi:hypothetical protein
VTDELTRLRAERDELQRRLDATAHATPPRHRVRAVTAAILVVVAALALGAATTGLWTRVNTLDEDRFVELVGPLGSDPDVQVALGNFTTAQLEQAIDARGLLQDVLPPRATVLATPLAAAFDGYLADRVDQFFSSDEFEELWVAIVGGAHQRALAVLEGNAENVDVVDGKVVLNWVPVLNRLLDGVASQVSGLLGRDVELPEITPGMLPDEARARIEQALGRELPSDWGTVTVFDDDRLTAMQDGLELFRRGTALLAIAALLLVALAIAVSPRRRRTVLQLALATGVVFVLLRRVVFAAEANVLDAVRVEENRRAVEATWDQVFSGYLGLTTAILWACAIVATIAFLAGPSRVAVAIRRNAVALAGGAAGVARRAGDRVESAGWVLEHREALQVGVAIAAALIVLVADLSFFGLLVVLVLLGALELLLWRAGSVAPAAAGTASEPPAA